MPASQLPVDVVSVIATMGGAIMQFAVPLGVFGWWLSGRFRNIEERQREQIERLAKEGREHLDKHEEKDGERHEDNLERFRTISVSLARLGASNGSGH